MIKLERPDLKQTGVGWAARERILRAVAAAFTEEERTTHFDSASACHCGRCTRYARCKFRAPRCAADVVHNVCATGSKAGARVATVGLTVDHFEDDVVLSLGMGAGTCVAGWVVARGAELQHLYGVEIEPLATRVARAAFPTARIAPTIADLELPHDGRLIVISSLVMNLVPPATATEWAARIADARREFLHLNIGRFDEPGALQALEGAFRLRGLTPLAHRLPSDVDSYDCGYATTATWWIR
jgi:hypothetical protein